MLWIICGLAALVWLGGWRLTFLCTGAAVLSVLLLALATATAALLLFLFDTEAIRAWTLPAMWLDELTRGDSLLALVALLPLAFLGDIVRSIAHILLHHPHPVLFTTILPACGLIAYMWWTAAHAIRSRLAR